MTATRTGAWPLLWPPLLLLLPGLPGQPWGAEAQAQVCSINKTLFEVKENSNVSEPLVDIYVPDGLQVALGPSTTPSAFRMQGTQLFLSSSPDYEATTFLEADLECRRGTTVVTRLRVFVTVLDVNDNPPRFPFDTLQKGVEEDTKVNSTVIPETELEAKDLDESDTLFYTLQEVTPGAGVFFSLAGANHPALRLDRTLDFDKWSEMTFRLLVRDTQQEDKQPSHTATATLILKVLPADLRPPWFLPCSYSDGHVCIQAQYQGAVPTGHTLPGPLILRPGPIYAEDGDSGIGQPIIYSLLGGNQGGVFIIDANSGNLTMASGIPSPTTFVLLVKGEQADLARYSVTQVTVEARAATGSPPRFPQSLYQGTVVPGSGAGTVVRDATSPAQPLRIQAQDPDFPDFNSAITYRITNCSEFRMEGETVLTTTQLPHAVVFYAEVEATNTVTTAMATTVAEIRVSEQEAPSTDPDPRNLSADIPGYGVPLLHANHNQELNTDPDPRNLSADIPGYGVPLLHANHNQELNTDPDPRNLSADIPGYGVPLLHANHNQELNTDPDPRNLSADIPGYGVPLLHANHNQELNTDPDPRNLSADIPGYGVPLLHANHNQELNTDPDPRNLSADIPGYGVPLLHANHNQELNTDPDPRNLSAPNTRNLSASILRGASGRWPVVLCGGHGRAGRRAGRPAAAGPPRRGLPGPQALWPVVQVLLRQSSRACALRL
ncbi:cadherin-related family member 5 isoform X1 [Lepus europaeus]|uniref:cadherin-related family member 5 isoform X1 n=1 Tax=Lepus europaeus TaxID=9983 RepID=UPI002B4A6833|nr:cadherin-related family member 5 isoform X1 [Lepus europaeus]